MTATPGTVTYRRRSAGDGDDALTILRRAGLDIDVPSTVRVTVLDTFDARVGTAGGRLEVVARDPDGDDARVLMLHAQRGPAAAVDVAGIPCVASEVPAGPLRSRVARLVDVRALQPRLVLESGVAEARRTNRAGKVVVLARVHDRPRAGTGGAAMHELAESGLVEVVELVGYEAVAREVRDRLDAAGWTGEAGDVVDCAARWLAIDLDDRSVAPGVPLDPDSTAIDAFRVVLANLRDAMVSTWDGTVADTDPEYLHDFRVAVRRTRSVLKSARRVVPDAVRAAAREGFGWLGNATGPPRDLDVAAIEWPDVVREFDADVVAALEPTREHLTRDRADAHRQLAATLTSERAREFLAWWSGWLDGPLDPSSGEVAPLAAHPVGPLVAKRIRRTHRALIEAGRAVTPDTPAAEVHELRKDAKRLRYLVECFGGLYEPAARKPFVRVLKALQDTLGAHQDADVAMARLRDEAASARAAAWPAPSLLAIGQLVERQDQRRAAMRDELVARFADFDTKATRQALDRLLDSAQPRHASAGSRHDEDSSAP